MIRGLDKFQEHFAAVNDSFVLIGGAACHEWFRSQGLEFRATKDLDIVLIVEALDEPFVERFWQFIEEGQYEIRQKSEGDRILHRFARPQNAEFPVMLELFSRHSDLFVPAPSQTIVPVSIDEADASLSAILLDESYYELIRLHRIEKEGPPYVGAGALIPLKAKAWLDLSHRRAHGDEKVDGRDIDKHRSDVFRLAATLPGEEGPEINANVQQDLRDFLEAFPLNSPEWDKIKDALKPTFGGTTPAPELLIQAVTLYFRI